VENFPNATFKTTLAAYEQRPKNISSSKCQQPVYI